MFLSENNSLHYYTVYFKPHTPVVYVASSRLVCVNIHVITVNVMERCMYMYIPVDTFPKV